MKRFSFNRAFLKINNHGHVTYVDALYPHGAIQRMIEESGEIATGKRCLAVMRFIDYCKRRDLGNPVFEVTSEEIRTAIAASEAAHITAEELQYLI